MWVAPPYSHDSLSSSSVERSWSASVAIMLDDGVLKKKIMSKCNTYCESMLMVSVVADDKAVMTDIIPGIEGICRNLKLVFCRVAVGEGYKRHVGVVLIFLY